MRRMTYVRDSGEAFPGENITLGAPQRDITRTVAEVPLETVEQRRGGRIRRGPSGRHDRRGARVKSRPCEAGPFVPPDALGHPRFARP